MELWLGPSHRGSAFGSREEMHQAWLRHRDRLMGAWAKHGKRPAGWWEFEAPFPRPFEREQSTLFEANLLDPEERAELVAWWHREFERAWEPHFFHVDGPNRVFEGAVARRKHWNWADIPASLLKEWTARRRRRGRAISELAKALPATAIVDEPTKA
jgi:hypothetical protein